MNAAKNAGRVIPSRQPSEKMHLERIAELEAEVLALSAELARYKALALSGATVGLGSVPAAETSGLSGRKRARPIHVTADGTQGMRRGVSGGQTPASRDLDDQS